MPAGSVFGEGLLVQTATCSLDPQVTGAARQPSASFLTLTGSRGLCARGLTTQGPRLLMPTPGASASTMNLGAETLSPQQRAPAGAGSSPHACAPRAVAAVG